jgi:hypothetical protein
MFDASSAESISRLQLLSIQTYEWRCGDDTRYTVQAVLSHPILVCSSEGVSILCGHVLLITATGELRLVRMLGLRHWHRSSPCV